MALRQYVFKNILRGVSRGQHSSGVVGCGLNLRAGSLPQRGRGIGLRRCEDQLMWVIHSDPVISFTFRCLQKGVQPNPVNNTFKQVPFPLANELAKG